jgi:adenosine deaminase
MRYTQVYHACTPSQDLVQRLQAMPKAEIHVHLEGATSPELIFKMARRNAVPLPVATIEEWKAFYAFRDFNHFIEIYMLTVACMLTPQDFTDMVVDFMAQQAAQNIRYSEVFFSVALHLNRLPAAEILRALAEGLKQGKALYGVDAAFLSDISRQNCVEKHAQRQVLDFALAARDLGIGSTLSIAGMEIGYPSALYQEVFDEARRQGLHVIAHAGETGDHRIVRDVLDVLQPERIGHGIGALGDPDLVAELHRRQIPIEVSPHSNYCTRVIPIDQPHPIRRMLDLGLNVTVNSDDPPMFSTDLNNEYVTLAAQGFTFEELWQLNRNGLQASFLEPDRKAAILREWEQWG